MVIISLSTIAVALHLFQKEEEITLSKSRITQLNYVTSDENVKTLIRTIIERKKFIYGVFSLFIDTFK